MRIAEVMADQRWYSSTVIKHRFLEKGWAFINSQQISTLCRITAGIESRKLSPGSEVEYRLNEPNAFSDYMARDGVGSPAGFRHRNHDRHMERVLSPARPLGPSDE